MEEYKMNDICVNCGLKYKRHLGLKCPEGGTTFSLVKDEKLTYKIVDIIDGNVQIVIVAQYNIQFEPFTASNGIKIRSECCPEYYNNELYVIGIYKDSDSSNILIPIDRFEEVKKAIEEFNNQDGSSTFTKDRDETCSSIRTWRTSFFRDIDVIVESMNISDSYEHFNKLKGKLLISILANLPLKDMHCIDCKKYKDSAVCYKCEFAAVNSVCDEIDSVYMKMQVTKRDLISTIISAYKL